jgi:hypothetical protein
MDATASSKTRSKTQPLKRLPSPGSDATSHQIAHYLTDDRGCKLTVQQLGQLVGCSPPTIYRVLGGSNTTETVSQHLRSLWALLSGRGTFGEEISGASLEDRMKVVQRMARQSTSDRIWESGLREAAQLQLRQLRGAA